ncbi:MAG: isochorismatase family protein [Candidatus Cloacimonetes bacterium]|nr:isochorismatase family protein [Candidatus Cloacimonadota bacterium]
MEIVPRHTLFAMLDLQEKFKPAIHNLDTVIHNCNILNQAAKLFSINLFVTEQNPKRLGKTMEEIIIPNHARVFEKHSFSFFDGKINALLHNKNLIVIYGIEAHICVMQSAMDALKAGYTVMIVGDAISSRNPVNKEIAIDRLHQLGCTITSTEMLLFEILKTAKHPKFKDIIKLVK